MSQLDDEIAQDSQLVQTIRRRGAQAADQLMQNGASVPEWDGERQAEMVRALLMGSGGLDLSQVPGADFYYKMVAKIGNEYFSIWDCECQYKINEIKYQEVKKNKQGGYFVYRELENAIFADVMFNMDGNFSAPRTILKCICWGKGMRYGPKLCFSYLVPVADLGLPQGYRTDARSSMQAAMEERERLRHIHRERVYDLALQRLNNESREVYENNIFENYFSASVVAQVEALIEQERRDAENNPNQGEGEAN